LQHASAGLTYGDNFEDRMTTAGAVTMLYDGEGNRVSRTAGGVTTRFLVDDFTPTGYAQVAEELVSGAVTVRYTHGIQRISQSRAGVTHFYGYDGGGTVRQLTDASGAVTDTYTFDGFGVLIGGTGSTTNAYRYRGEQWDASVGMYYLRARWYEPAKGRFWTADKFEPVGNVSTSLNAYLFAGADPVNYVDPTGYSPVMETSLPVGLIDAPIAARFLIPIRTFPIIEGYGALGTVKVTAAGMFVLCILEDSRRRSVQVRRNC
jgi:RHS repeat-associated protein